MTTYYDTLQSFVTHSDTLLSAMCHSLLQKGTLIPWQFRSGTVSDDGTCTAEFDAPTSFEGRKYHQTITVSDDTTTIHTTVI